MPKRRSVRFLLLPVLALVFLFGWLMYSVGGGKNNSKKGSPKKMHSIKQSIAQKNDLEMGLTAELAEEEHQVTRKKPKK